MSNLNLLSMVLGVPLMVGFTYVGVGYFLRWAIHRNLVDTPNSRSAHTQPTPRGGGVVVVILSLVGLTSSLFLDIGSSLDIERPTLPFIAFINGAILIASVSWIDDGHPLPARLRFGVHSLAALLVLGALALSGVRSGVEWYTMPVLGLIIVSAFLWLVGLTNAYNFMDGIDGMAGLQAVIAGFAWAFIGWYVDFPLVTILGFIVAATSLGFLGHNWSPAQIFMGDVCSAFLGFTFAVLPLIAAQSEPKLLIFGFITVWPFVFDTSQPPV